MVKYTLKILQHLLQDSQSVSDHFGTLCIIQKNLCTITSDSWLIEKLHIKTNTETGYRQKAISKKVSNNI